MLPKLCRLSSVSHRVDKRIGVVEEAAVDPTIGRNENWPARQAQTCDPSDRLIPTIQVGTYCTFVDRLRHAAQPSKFLARISRRSKFRQVRHEPMSTPRLNGVGGKTENGIIGPRPQLRDCNLLPRKKHLQCDRLPSFKRDGNPASRGQGRLHYSHVESNFFLVISAVRVTPASSCIHANSNLPEISDGDAASASRSVVNTNSLLKRKNGARFMALYRYQASEKQDPAPG
jgi:hypothetical protein